MELRNKMNLRFIGIILVLWDGIRVFHEGDLGYAGRCDSVGSILCYPYGHQ